jgi:capsular exopolysaccharide synthesis family protein
MDISAYLKPLIKWWRLLFVVTALAIIASAISVFLQPETYVSRTTLMIGQAINNPNPDSGSIYIATQLASIYADMANREPIQVATMNALKITWLPSYEARVVPNTQLIEIAVTDTNPQRAQIIANELASQLMKQSPATGSSENAQQQEFLKQQLASLQTQITEAESKIEELQKSLAGMSSASQIATTEKEINDLTTKLTTLRQNYANFLANSQEGALNILSVVEPASLPSNSVGTNKLLIIMLAAMVGFSLAAGGAYLIEYIDRTIKTTNDVERVLNYPVIGYLSEIVDDEEEDKEDKEEGEDGEEKLGAKEAKTNSNATYVLENPNTSLAESFRLLKSNLDFFGIDGSSKTILITSPSQGNGKTTIAVNLALSMSMMGDQRVVLVDADLRRPAVHSALDLSSKPGLSDMIRGEKNSKSVIKCWGSDKLDVITAGTRLANVTEVVSTRRIGSILDDLKESYDIVIVDAPPLVISDAYNLASKVDGVIVVLVPGQTREEQAKVMKEQLDRAGATVIGVVFNKISMQIATTQGDYQYLSLYSPKYYSDYIADPSEAKPSENGNGRSKKLLDFFEHGEVPTEVSNTVERAVTAIKTQPRNLVDKLKKPSKEK